MAMSERDLMLGQRKRIPLQDSGASPSTGRSEPL